MGAPRCRWLSSLVCFYCFLACTQPKAYVPHDGGGDTGTLPVVQSLWDGSSPDVPDASASTGRLDASSASSGTPDASGNDVTGSFRPAEGDASPDVSTGQRPDPASPPGPVTLLRGVLSVDAVVERAGDAFIAGLFRGTVEFGPDSRLTSTSEADVFVARYQPNGRLVWVRRFGSGIAYALSPRLAQFVTADEFLVTAAFKGDQVDIDGTIIRKAADGEFTTALARFQLDGRLVWAKAGGGHDVVVHRQEIATADDGGGVTRYNTGGTVLWRKVMPHALAVHVDSEGSLYAGGTFYNPHDFGGVVLRPTMGTSLKDHADGYVVKYSPEGKLLWAETYGGVGHGEVGDLAVDPAGDVYVTGGYRGQLRVQDHDSTSAGDWDFFLAKHGGADGKLKWMAVDGDEKPNFGGHLLVLPSGHLLVGGNGLPIWRYELASGKQVARLSLVSTLSVARAGDGYLFVGTGHSLERVPGI